jgi:integral membrane protein
MLKTFRILALLEGISYILLLFVGVPLKHWGGNDILVKGLGMPHGLLFVAYIILAIALKDSQKWNLKDMFIILIASILPLGTFYVDFKYLKTKKEAV